jgi:hypothetical protein
MYEHGREYAESNESTYGKSISDIVSDRSLLDQDVVVYLTGFSLFRGTAYDGPMEDAIREMINENEFNAVVQSFTSPIGHKGPKKRAKKFIEENRKGNGKVILIGYSWGGDNVVEISHDPDFPEIDLLISIDPSNGARKDKQDSFRVGEQAKQAVNLYQPHVDATKSGNRYISGAENRYIKGTKEYPEVRHHNADEAAQSEVVNLVREKLEN